MSLVLIASVYIGLAVADELIGVAVGGAVQLRNVRADRFRDPRDHRDLERSSCHHNPGGAVGLTVGVGREIGSVPADPGDPGVVPDRQSEGGRVVAEVLRDSVFCGVAVRATGEWQAWEAGVRAAVKRVSESHRDRQTCPISGPASTIRNVRPRC